MINGPARIVSTDIYLNFCHSCSP